ncbi:MAG: hypothetical protein AB7O37_15245 [Vicinamibacteria bacterium]
MLEPAVVVIGGGTDGDLYLRQLLRAAAASRIRPRRIVVVDRDAGCRAAARVRGDPRAELAVAEWDAWLDAELGRLLAGDQLVPYHWAPHLLVGWLAREALRAGGRVVRQAGGLPARGLPFERETRDGDRALSYATWPCPPTCIEPALCPHTRGPKSWSLAGELSSVRLGEPYDEALVLPSFHYAWGVASIPVARILDARARVVEAARSGARRFLVATASHCHGLATLLHVAP